MIKIKQFVFNPFSVNTYVVFDSDTRDAIVVDPGMTSNAEKRKFDTFISENKLNVTQIINTHLHLDHCFGDNYVRNRYGVKVYANADDAFLGESLSSQARQFGLSLDEDDPVKIDVTLKEGDTIKLGKYNIEVLAVPGHSPGSLVLYSPDGHFAIVGDVIFERSIGRTDLPGGNHSQLIQGIKQKVLSLPADTLLLSGHGQHTSVENESRYNPYL